MKVTPSALPDVLIIEPQVFEDERGFFYESYNEREFAIHTGLSVRFVQDNHSKSRRNILRGLHYQVQAPQGKLVRVASGEIFDVAVDIRKNSTTLGQCATNILSSENRKMIWIPPGFAHGFLVSTDQAEVLYKTTEYWAPALERCIIWNDSALGIPWPNQFPPVLSERDKSGVPFKDAELLD